MILRTGIGYDIHRLVPNRKLILGGVHIPFNRGFLAHSDGDVLLHAIIDALLGASGLGDIGEIFPPDDSTWKDACSKKLLTIAWEKIKKNNWLIGNIDCVVVLQEPKFITFREKVQLSIASILEINKEQIFVKAKTKEGIDTVGKGEAIEAWASCLLYKNK